MRYDIPLFTPSLHYAMRHVSDFHRAFGHPAPSIPTRLTPERVAARAKWSAEENQEFIDAETLVDQADAAIDKLYFAFGDLVEMGLDPSPLWNIVQAANMAKLGPDGKPLFHPDGKTKKPDGWQRPEPWLQAEVARQIRLADGTSPNPILDLHPIAYGHPLTSLQQPVDHETA